MRAIVLGATGLVGRELVNLLLEDEHFTQVVTLARTGLNLEHDKLQKYVVDFSNIDAAKTLVTGHVLFSCLGTTRKAAGSIQAQRVVDLNYQARFAELARENEVDHYVLVSSSGANSRSPNPYLKMKGDLEDRVKALNFNRLSLVQPSLLLGKRDQTRLGESVGALVLPMICKLPLLSRYRPIHAKAVATRMLQIAKVDSTGEATYTLEEVFPD